MTRPLDTARRAELASATLRYLARHGIARLSLRPLAEALGTSSRMLVHYFGTKEALIGEALTRARPDIPAQLAQHEKRGDSPATIARGLWRQIVDGQEEPQIRVLLETMALALTQPEPFGQHATAAVQGWVAPLADALATTGLDRRGAEARATLLVSGLRGLALDRYVTREARRTDDAADLLIEAATAPVNGGTE